MNILPKQAFSKLPSPNISLTKKARNALLAVSGISAIFIAKNEIGKQQTRNLIELKKQRLQMVK